jgi:hypothetical protein
VNKSDTAPNRVHLQKRGRRTSFQLWIVNQVQNKDRGDGNLIACLANALHVSNNLED